MQIQGILKKIRYQNPDNGWGVFTVSYRDDICKHESSFTGALSYAVIGQSYLFEGEFETHPTYGPQFHFTNYTIIEEETSDGAFALLTSSRFPGVGPRKAQAIVRHFGKKTLSVIRDTPERLTEIAGIGPKLAAQIHANMPNLGVWEQLRMLLSGSTDNAVNKIYDMYGDKSVSVVKKNPYTLIRDIDGFGFLKADAIAASVGITGDHPLRVQAAIYHVLNSASEQEGHCFAYAPALQTNVEQLIPGVSIETMADAIKEMLSPDFKKMRLHVDDDGAIYLNYLYYAEKISADVIKRFLALAPHNDYSETEVNLAAGDIELETGIALEATQLRAVQEALNNPFTVITGGPGTGKTTIVRTIIRAIERHTGTSDDVYLMAPTGRAARRMHEATGHDARTIHMSIGYSGKTGKAYYDAEHKLPCSWVIVDEASMIDISLAQQLLQAIDVKRTRLIFIGDVDQLPPVGPGIFFRSLIKSYRVPTVRLKFSFRQTGSIAQNASKINDGMGPHSYVEDDDFIVVKATKDDAPEKAVKAYLSLVKEYGLQEAVLLSPKKKGNGGTEALNKTIQERLLGKHPAGEIIKTFDYEIGVGDRIMLTKNNVFEGHANGDLGTVLAISNLYFTVQFDGDDESTEIEITNVKNNFILAYASTVHKSQGSEYLGVVVLFTSEHTFMGERSIIYTAVTRAKKKLFLVGDARAIARAVATVKPITRNSKLVDRINET